MAEQRRRACTVCLTPLSSYNPTAMCAACVRAGGAACIPRDCWYRPMMREALSEHDFGQVSRLLQQWTPLTQRQIAELVGMDQPGLSRIENDKQRVKHIGVFFRFIEGLGIPLELVLPPGLSPGNGSGDPVKRRTLLGSAAGMAAEVVSVATEETAEHLNDLLSRAHHEPAQVVHFGRDDVGSLRETVDDLYSLDARLGGDRLWRFALAQLQMVDIIVNRFTYSDSVGLELQRIIGELKTSVGWYSFDAGKQRQAHQQLSEALNLAYMTDGHLLVTRTLANMARQAVHLSRPREAVLLAQRGRDNAGRWVTPRVRALLAIREAQGWAGLHQLQSCDDAIGRAHREFERGTSERDPEWVSFLNEAELACLEGMCRSDLGQHALADDLLKQSIALHTEGFRRNMSIGLIRLARNALLSGDKEQAGAVAIQAPAVATEITSARVRGELRSLGKAFTPHTNLPAVSEAVAQIALIA